MDWLLLGNVYIAGALGAVIGFERELKNRPAGLRTHIFVCATAALLVGLGPRLVDSYQAMESSQVIQTDPVRIVEAVITGVSFIGAGTIIFRKGPSRVEGLTTAASLLFTAAIGIVVALHEYLVAAALTFLVIVVLAGLRLAERLVLGSKGKHKTSETVDERDEGRS